MEYYIIFYFLAVNLIASILSVSDKRRAQKNKWRVSEAVLLLTAAMGGAVGEYITMKAIHHKTKKAKFMVGLPLIIFVQIIILILIIYKAAFI